MNQKDRLVQLLEKFGEEKGVIMNLTESIAEYLIENGAVALPCKVGDTVYSLNDGKIVESEVYALRIDTLKSNKRICVKEKQYKFFPYRATFKFSSIGKTVFLTREEAEKALERMKEDEKDNI